MGSSPIVRSLRSKAGLVAALAAAWVLALAWAPVASAGTQCLVINEVYPAGGTSGATYNADYVELLNRCNMPVSLTGVTLVHVYWVFDGSMYVPTQVSVGLTGTLAAGGYYLVAGAPQAGMGAPLSTPDASLSFELTLASGSLFLENGTPGFPCGDVADRVDLVGYNNLGTVPDDAPCMETASAAQPAAMQPNTSAYHRLACTVSPPVANDSDNNSNDFTFAGPSPQNTASTPAGTPCGGAAPPTAVSVRSLIATRAGSGVAVRWRTASELDLLGFRVYREVAGKRVRLSRLIAARGSGRYSFLDRRAPGRGAVRYWIEAVNLDGSRRWHGPARLR